MSIRRPLLAVAALSLACGSVFAADAPSTQLPADSWAQWRGPTATGAASPDADPPTEWGEAKNIRWKVKLPGSGSATPIVVGDKIFIQAAISVGTTDQSKASPAAATPESRERDSRGAEARGGGRGEGRGRGGRGGGFGSGPAPTNPFQFVLLCLDRKSGKTLWQQVAKESVPHEGHHKDHGFSSHSPVSDGSVVIAYFGSRGLHAFDLTGKRLWEKDLGKQSTRNGFGEGSSPTLHGDTVVVNWDHEGDDDFIAAFDKNTGKEKWRTKRSEATSWTTPLIVEHEGKAQVVVGGTNRSISYDLETGKEIWSCQGLTTNVIPSAVSADGVVYLTSGFRGAALVAVKLGGTGDLTGTPFILWTHDKSTPYVPSPLLADGKLYFFRSNDAILSVFDVKTGKPLIDADRVDAIQNVYASPIYAGGRLYFVGREGATVVMKQTAPDKLEELALNELNDPIDASPVAVGKELFLRGREHLYCIAAD